MAAPDLARGFAAALSELHQKGVGTKRVAQALDVTTSAVGRYASGERTVPVEKLPIMDKLCGQPRGYVLRLAGHVEDRQDARSALAADPLLSPELRETLLQVYDIFRSREREHVEAQARRGLQTLAEKG